MRGPILQVLAKANRIDSCRATCPIGLITAYADEVKDSLNIPGNMNVVIGVALGYPDLNSPFNRFKSRRENVEKFTRWID